MTRRVVRTTLGGGVIALLLSSCAPSMTDAAACQAFWSICGAFQ